MTDEAVPGRERGPAGSSPESSGDAANEQSGREAESGASGREGGGNGPDDQDAGQDGTSERWLTSGVASVGAASLFSDAGHEITTALLPSFVTSVLHSSAGVLGTIEGVSDALMGVMKLLSGPWANEPRRRGRLATNGYLGTAAATGAVGLATGVWQVGVLRATAWMARGARSPSRDALLTSLAPSHAPGRAFGIERAGDNLGAVAGPLLAALLVGAIGIRPAMWCAAIPGALAALAITVAASRAPRQAAGAPADGSGLPHRLGLPGLFRPMIPIAFFECGNVTVTLLILRATQLLHTDGRSLAAATTLAIVVYAGHNAVAAGTAFVGGHWIDRMGPTVPFAAAAALYVVAYGGFAFGPRQWPLVLLAFAVAGAGIGLSETAESTLVALAAPTSRRGSAFGVLGAVQSAGDVLSSVTAGLLYTAVSPVAAFAYAAGWMVLSLGTVSFLTPSRLHQSQSAGAPGMHDPGGAWSP